MRQAIEVVGFLLCAKIYWIVNQISFGILGSKVHKAAAKDSFFESFWKDFAGKKRHDKPGKKMTRCHQRLVPHWKLKRAATNSHSEVK